MRYMADGDLGMRRIKETRHPSIGRVLAVKQIDREDFESKGSG